LLLIPAIGTAGAERALIGIAATAALAAFVPLFRTAHATLRLGGTVALAAAMGLAGWLAWSVTPVPWVVVAFGRNVASWIERAGTGIVADVPAEPGAADVFCTYVGEGTNVSVAVTKNTEGVRSFHGAGKVQASTQPVDMRLQRMLGHLPALLHKKPESVLVVACGAGITAGTFVLHPDVQRIVICDIEPLVPKTVTPMFGTENYHVVDGIARENPSVVNGKQVRVVYDDGRHFLRTTHDKFDIITSDPIDPWVKGCAALNTVEYYQMCRDRLNPGGSVSLWFPINEGNVESTKSAIATFFQVFPHGIVWSNEYQGQAYDAVLFGQVEPTVIDVDELQRRLERPNYQLVKQSLREVGFGEIKSVMAGVAVVPEEGIDLLTTYAGQASFLKEWSRGAQINTDRNLRLQYLAGLSLNSSMGERILSGILAYYRFPNQTFVGSQEAIETLKQALDESGRKESAVRQ
jgi:spermidine synthase